MDPGLPFTVSRKPPNYLGPSPALNSAPLLPISSSSDTPSHSCLEAVEALCSPQSGLLDQPVTDTQFTFFVDGSSLIERSGNQQVAYVVVTSTKMVETIHLLVGTSSQKAESIALTRALQIANGQWDNIYTDSKHAFLIAHTHSVLWKERGFLTTKSTLPIDSL